MPEPKEPEETDDDKVKRLVKYYTNQEEARRKGLDTIISVRLSIPPELLHILDPGESPEQSTICWINSKCDWPTMMEQLSDQHAPMIVKWVLPIGKLPKLLLPST